jgi:uncharacterized protein
VKISYDPVKRDITLTDRGLDFDDAPIVMAGPTLTQENGRFDYGEERFVTYGFLRDRLVMFAWTPTEDGIRVISMRKCHDKEYRKVAPRMG